MAVHRYRPIQSYTKISFSANIGQLGLFLTWIRGMGKLFNENYSNLPPFFFPAKLHNLESDWATYPLLYSLLFLYCTNMCYVMAATQHMRTRGTRCPVESTVSTFPLENLEIIHRDHKLNYE